MKNLIKLIASAFTICFVVNLNAQTGSFQEIETMIDQSNNPRLNLTNGISGDFGGFRYNNAASAYGDGNDFSIFTFNSRDLTLRSGSGNICLSGSKIGIGTFDPQDKLHVFGGFAKISTSNPLQYIRIGHGSSNAFIDREIGNIDFRYGNSNQMSITPAGNVGIGKSSNLSAKLWVRETGSVYGIVIEGYGANVYPNLAFLSNGSEKANIRYNTNAGQLQFSVSANGAYKMYIDDNGSVGIGTNNLTGSEKLKVNGTIRAKEIIVETANFPDYVFGDDYDLMTIDEKMEYIRQFKHLPAFRSEKEIVESGLKVQETVIAIVQELEETVLQTGHLNDRLKHVEEENELLQEIILKLVDRVEALESK